MAELVKKYQQYDDYKDSGVESTPEMPSHWIAGKVKYVTESLNSIRVPLSSEERGSKKGEYPYYGASGIIDYVDDYLFNEETILFGEDGANLISRSTPLAFLANGKYWVNNHAHILRTKDGINDYWVMCFENIDVTAFVSGSAQPKLTAEALGDLQVVYPPTITEREIIANFLDFETAQIDTLIDKQQTLIQLLKEKRQAVISHAVTKGLNPDALMKDSGVEWLGGIPNHWQMKKLKYIGEAKNGLIYSPDNVTEAGLGTLVLRSSNIQNARLAFEDNVYVDMKVPERSLVRKDDILICSRNGSRRLIGKNALITEDLVGQAFGAFMVIFRSDINVYLYWILNSPLFEYQSGSFLTSTINQLTIGNLNSMEVPIPPEEEQFKIIKYLEVKMNTFDNLISKAQQAIQLMQERRTALISAAVTGKIDVRGWQATEQS